MPSHCCCQYHNDSIPQPPSNPVLKTSVLLLCSVLILACCFIYPKKILFVAAALNFSKMLEPIRHIIVRQRNILASSSVRRQEILKSVNFNFEIYKPEFEENLDKSSFSHPCEYVKENAKQKALSVWKCLAKETRPADLVIGCDTVVTLGERIFEKPKDAEDATKMLTKLSGRTHTVFTGVALITGKTSSNEPLNDDYLVTTFHEATDVTMSELDKGVIEAYVKTGEPLDKAGSYGIQGIGSTLIETIRGDYFNVVGLPLHRLAKELYYMYTE